MRARSVTNGNQKNLFLPKRQSRQASEAAFRRFRPKVAIALNRSGLFSPAEGRNVLARLRRINIGLDRWPIINKQSSSASTEEQSAAIDLLLNAAPVLLGIKPRTHFQVPDSPLSTERFLAWVSQMRAAGLLDCLAEKCLGLTAVGGQLQEPLPITYDIDIASKDRLLEAFRQGSNNSLGIEDKTPSICRALCSRQPERVFDEINALDDYAVGVSMGYPETAILSYGKTDKPKHFLRSKWMGIAISCYIDNLQTNLQINRQLNRYDATFILMGRMLTWVHRLPLFLYFARPQ